LRIANKLFSEEEARGHRGTRCGWPGMWKRDPWNGRISEGPGCTQRNEEEWRGAGCVYLAQREISGFSHHGFSEE
jgi:hypothetical protein